MNAILLPRAFCAVRSTALSRSARDNLRSRAARSILIGATTLFVSVAFFPTAIFSQRTESKVPRSSTSARPEGFEKTLSPDTQKALQEGLAQKERVEQWMTAGDFKKALPAAEELREHV